MRPRTTAGRGLLAGLLAATAIAVWFLIIDALLHQPFRTPAFLASALLGLDEVLPGALQIAAYTVAHYAVFIGVGIGAAWLLDRVDVRPGVLIGLVLGLLLFDLVFYAGVIMTGANVVRALGWPEVFIGSMIAGLTLSGFLAWTSDEPYVSWRAALREHRIVREALVAGLLGASAVAIWFLLVDAVQGRPLFTPAALGSALFFGARGADAVQITAITVLGYTGLHIAAFAVVGFIAAALVAAAEKQPPILLGIVLLFVAFEVLLLGLIAIIATWLLDALHWWTIVVANLIAAGAMGGYLLYEHPLLREEFTHELEEELHGGGAPPA
jgi:hypothetical protein